MFVLDNKCLSTVDPYFRAIPIKVSDWHTLCFAAIDDLVTNRVVVPYFVCFSINLPSSWLSVPPLPSAILDGRISRDLAHIVIISRLFIMDQKYRLWKFRINTGDRPKKKKRKQIQYTVMSYQLYRNTTLGHTLQESLDELIQVRFAPCI